VVSEPAQKIQSDPGELRLHPEWPRVTRLSRRVVFGLAALAALAISGTLIAALYRGSRPPASGELYNTNAKPAPDGLATLPRDYAGLPRNVPPLPDGRTQPLARAQAPPSGAQTSAASPIQQLITDETEGARGSRLFATTSIADRTTLTPPAPMPSDQQTATSIGRADTPAVDPDSTLAMQDRKAAFLKVAVDRKTVSPDRLVEPASRYIVQAGAVIAAALLTGIRSDLPGQVTAQVSENIYDSPTGNYLLIPQGSKLIGVYDSQITFGQDRVLLVWTRLIMPNGNSIVLERQSGADAEGFAGLADEVDHHWGRLFMAAALSTLLAVGSELGTNTNDDAIIQALRRGGSDSLNQTGQQVVRRNLNIQPTLTIRPGFPVRVIVNRDLVLMAYRS